MEPKNKDNRKSSLINIVLFFLLDIVIVSTLVFFSVSGQFSEHNSVLVKMDQIDSEKDFFNRFALRIINVSRMLAIVSTTSPQETVRLNGRIDTEINKLNTMVTDTVPNKFFYSSTIANLKVLHHYLCAIRSNEPDMNNCEAQLEKANKKAQDWYTKYIECISRKK